MTTSGIRIRISLAAGWLLLANTAIADLQIEGLVVDLNGRPLPQVQVSVTTGPGHAGADVITVFTGPDGRFAIPEPVSTIDDPGLGVAARALDYEQLAVSTETGDAGTRVVTLLMRRVENQVKDAPASAWLAGIDDRAEKARYIRNCADCHQAPSPSMRDYAALIADVDTGDPEDVRRQSWLSIAKYMNYLSGWEFGRANPDGPPPPDRAYSVGAGSEVAETMARHFVGPMDRISGYRWGAPLLANANTLIREYEVPGPNAIREAMLLGTPPRLWVADVATNRMYEIDVATGKQAWHEVPWDGAYGPHSLHRGGDGSLWITPLFPSVIARLDPDELAWQTWPMKTSRGEVVGIHDLSFGYEHELLSDEDGYIWYSDIGNNAVGYFDPATGDGEIFRTPEIDGRTGGPALLYGLIMTSDRRHIWYSQLGIGSFGSFNIGTREFETREVLPIVDAGPRRLTISDDDILYVPLFGAGQLIEYDTKARRQLGVYDLPDTGSAPYSVTWDPVRRVVWIATANADAIYRFDPADKSFAVLPLPRTGAFLRMIDVDPATGLLVSSYANIVEFVKGPRMALTIDPGDAAYANRLAGGGQ